MSVAPIFTQKEWARGADRSIVEELSSDDGSVSIKTPATLRNGGKFSSSGSPSVRGRSSED